MDSQRLENVTGWSSRPFADGYEGLRDLSDREFSGAVTEGMAWAFFLNGRIVGVFDGSIEDFEDADGTAYEAPHPSLPLLYAMQETGGETRAKYYTNDTPISEVDRTLSGGNFTGYVELSENVLSGDYYTVYHGGRSMSAAFVGSSQRLVTGDEAFEKADDEVGIYEVKTVPVEVVEIPGGAESDAAESAGAAGAAGAASATDESDGDDAIETAAADTGTADADAPADAADGEAHATDGEHDTADDVATESESTDTAAAESESTDTAAAESESTDTAPTDPSGDAAATPDTGITLGASDDDDSASTASTGATETGDSGSTVDADDGASASGPTESDADAPASAESGVTFGDDEDLDDTAVSDLADEVIPDTSLDEEGEADDATVFSAESEWQETTTIPALDPEETIDEAGEGERRRSGSGSAGGQHGRGGTTDHPGSAGASGSASSTGSGSRRNQRRQTGGTTARNGVSREQAAQLQEKLEASEEARQEAEQARQQLTAELESVREERDSLASERDELEAERDELAARASELDSRVAELEAQVERLETELAEVRADQPDPERAVSAREALDGTNLFVRYDSKSGGTLEKAHEGQVDREEVNTNLRLEHHTSFETEDAHVDGQPYEAFLHESIEYGFARWVVQDLLYEIRDTGHEAQLQDLYDAIPKIDRAELNGTVSISYTEDGEEHREQQRFDVVLRDRMGNPLLVANLNDSREAASESMMRELVENARRLAETSDSLGAGFLVTASFFAPEALETASEATSGGLLSRSKRESFVKLSRKQGFHLCLVETRNGDFHLNVPEL